MDGAGDVAGVDRGLHLAGEAVVGGDVGDQLVGLGGDRRVVGLGGQGLELGHVVHAHRVDEGPRVGHQLGLARVLEGCERHVHVRLVVDVGPRVLSGGRERVLRVLGPERVVLRLRGEQAGDRDAERDEAQRHHDGDEQDQAVAYALASRRDGRRAVDGGHPRRTPQQWRQHGSCAETPSVDVRVI